MNVNFGLFPPVSGKVKKADRKKRYTDRARADLEGWIGSSEAQDSPHRTMLPTA